MAERPPACRLVFVTAFLTLLLFAALSTLAKPIKRLDYEGFTAWIDCAKRRLTRFQYTAIADTGNYPRADDYARDPAVPKYCQQKSTRYSKL